MNNLRPHTRQKTIGTYLTTYGLQLQYIQRMLFTNTHYLPLPMVYLTLVLTNLIQSYFRFFRAAWNASAD